MTQCRDCVFYKETDDKKKYGLCEIKLPPWIDKEAIGQKANLVDRKDSCDLGRPATDDDL